MNIKYAQSTNAYQHVQTVANSIDKYHERLFGRFSRDFILV